MKTISAFISVLAVGIVSTALTAQQPPNRLSLDHYLDFQTVSNPQISPDGSQIVYTRGWIDQKTDSRESSLWIMDADGSRNRHLGDGSSAAWSSDGTRIAYAASGDPDGTQLFVRYMDAEGAASQITRVNERPRDLAWSPDGRYLAFRMLVRQEESWSIDLPDRPNGAEWTESPRIVERLVYRRDREGYRDQGQEHIFVVPADGGAARQVTRGSFDHGAPHWTPDDESIVFSSLLDEDADHVWRHSEVYSVSVETGEVTQLTHRNGPDHSPAVSPDGRLIAYVGYDSTDATYRDPDLYVMNIDGSERRMLTAEFDRTPSGPFWSNNGREIYFNVQSEGSHNLHAADLNGRVREVTTGVHVLRAESMSDNGLFAGTSSDPANPSDVVTFTARNPEPNRITRVNENLLAGVELGEVEEIWYEAPDGWPIQGWIVKPPEFDPNRRYPMQLHIHGGPHAMYSVGFNFGWQEQAAHDYVILYTNPRGSSGYGSEFGNAIKNAYPGDDYHDLMAGVDALLERGYVDEENMFVTGCSGGGVLTAWIVGHTDRFRAASSNCPVTNWLSFVGTTDGASWYRNFEALPWDDPSEHLRRSPLMYVGNVTTPTMLMTGEGDLRTPMAQTEEYYQALKLLRVPTAMVRFKDEWHGTSSQPSNFMRTQLYLRNWFERWMTEDGRRALQAGREVTRGG